MVSLNDGITAGANGATGSTGSVVDDVSTNGTTGVLGVKAGGGGGATSRANDGVPMGATADVNDAITENYDKKAGANSATGVASSGAVGAGIIGTTSKSTTTNAVVSMTAVCTTLSTGTSIHADKTDETQIVISLP